MSAYDNVVDVHLFQVLKNHLVVLKPTVFGHKDNHVEIAQRELLDLFGRLEGLSRTARNVPEVKNAHDALVDVLLLGYFCTLYDVSFRFVIPFQVQQFVDKRAFADTCYPTDGYVDEVGIQPLFFWLIFHIPAILENFLLDLFVLLKQSGTFIDLVLQKNLFSVRLLFKLLLLNLMLPECFI